MTRTKIVAKFQEKRTPVPHTASEDGAHHYRVTRDENFRTIGIRCPKCGHVNHMEHGDRLLCGCKTFIEMYGNSYRWWDISQELQGTADYSRVDPDDLSASIFERLIVDPVIRKCAEENASIMDAIKQVEVMVKLHENL